ncbi:MAG TPA: hypothetical protein PK971_09980, partial [Saprospiraceae bacterium]|nr:hypothetical protein [Saprospiraceae bacterium]
DPKIHYPKFNELLVQNTKPAAISLKKGRLSSIFHRFSRPNAPLPSPHKEGDELQKAAHLDKTRLLF